MECEPFPLREFNNGMPNGRYIGSWLAQKWISASNLQKLAHAESQTELFLELGICMDQHDHETHWCSSLVGLYFVFVYPLSFPSLKKEEVKITSGRIRCFFFQKKKLT